MPTNNIIYDASTGDERFPHGMRVSFIETTDTTLSNEKLYYETILKCCSPVKTTNNNWFYTLSSDLSESERLKKWIDEITPVFPKLDIRIIKSRAERINQRALYMSSISSKIFDLVHTNSSAVTISIKLALSVLSNSYYGNTNRDNYKTLPFTHLTFLFDVFIEYCINNKISINNTNYEKIIKRYVLKNIDQIRDEFKTPNSCYALLSYSSASMVTSTAIDFSSITVVNITEYMTEVIANNISSVASYIEKKIDRMKSRTDYDYYIQSLYSKREYNIQSYLAHHLIRAGLSTEFNEFIDQYFKIKKALPNEYFWNLIFLTQFGFRYYFYYWLTSAREFRLITEKEFMQEALRYTTDQSSLGFLRKFAIEHNLMTHNHMRNLYLAGDFKNIVMLLGNAVKIQVKPERRRVLYNLRIANFYVVMSMDEKYYHIRGDDFRMHKYLKSSFNIIPEKI
jgi:hypothetical protein